MVFHFGEQKFTPITEELESFLDWEYHLTIIAIILTHKPIYFKDFHALVISKSFIPKRSFSETYTLSFQLFTGKKLEEVRGFLRPDQA